MSLYKSVIHFGPLDVILGLLNPLDDEIINALNFSILFAKQFIYKSKINEKSIGFELFFQMFMEQTTSVTAYSHK